MRECRTMDEVREEIDRLDRQLVTLLAERSGYVGQAARIKTQENQIRDAARIDDVIAKVRRHSEAAGLDAEVVAEHGDDRLEHGHRRHLEAEAAILEMVAERAIDEREQDHAGVRLDRREYTTQEHLVSLRSFALTSSREDAASAPTESNASPAHAS